jgi:hypothetical protein
MNTSVPSVVIMTPFKDKLQSGSGKVEAVEQVLGFYPAQAQ